MSEPEDIQIRIPASVKRLGKGHWEAWTKISSGSAVVGQGATRAEAIADLTNTLAWLSHFTPHGTIVHDHEGVPNLVRPAPQPGWWIVQTGLNNGYTQRAASFSDLKRVLQSKDGL